MRQTAVLIVSLLVLAAAPVSAARWTLDPDHSEIEFKIQHVHSTVTGHFSGIEADVAFDPENPAGSRFDFTVAVDTVNTRNTKRDTHLRSPDFFDTATFPHMRFVSRKVSRLEGDTYALEGDLTIKDVTRPLTLTFVHHPEKENPFDQAERIVGFDARFALNRLDYGVGFGKFFFMGAIGNEVRISISLEMKRRP